MPAAPYILLLLATFAIIVNISILLLLLIPKETRPTYRDTSNKYFLLVSEFIIMVGFTVYLNNIKLCIKSPIHV